jgi:succinyl-diaminopimelate desuccinylase
MNKLVSSILTFTQDLIRIQTQAEIDPLEPIFEYISHWLNSKNINNQSLFDNKKKKIAILTSLGKGKNYRYCLNACADTAPFGDLEAWIYPPTAGEIIDGWLYGRGSADSKIAISIFAHIIESLKREEDKIDGVIDFLIDGDEHTGRFGGIKAYVNRVHDITGVMIGYPGNVKIVIGARGFYRVIIKVYGTSAHSGASKKTGMNAVVKASHLVNTLSRISFTAQSDEGFNLSPQLTVTGIKGGCGYSTVPDYCEVLVDVRLTPSFDSEKAFKIINNSLAELDKDCPSWHPTTLTEEESWPAYQLLSSSPLVRTLVQSASHFMGKDIPTAICGPSNIGNYLASLGIEATCGFGVSYKNIHAPNECIDISSIEAVYKTYLRAIRLLALK